jgi:competence protein ComEA
MKSLIILMLFSGVVTPAVAFTDPARPVVFVQEASNARASSADLVNINTATAAQLEALPGIGPATAKRIIEHREKNGAFKKPEDLMNVRGIGEKAFLRLRPLVTVGAGTSKPAATQP